MTLLHVSSDNIHWPNTADQKKHDIQGDLDEVDVECVQENYRTQLQAYLGGEFDTLDTNAVGKRDCAVGWRTSRITDPAAEFVELSHMDKGSHKTFSLAVVSGLVDGHYPLTIACGHPPHGKYTREDPGIYREFANGLIEWGKAQKSDALVVCDWNRKIGSDPELDRIAEELGWTFYGGGERGIDGFLGSPGVTISHVREIGRNKRFSDHPKLIAGVRVPKEAHHRERHECPLCHKLHFPPK